MWTEKHWKILFFMLCLLFFSLILQTLTPLEKADVSRLDLEKVQALEEEIQKEVSYYENGKLLINQAPYEALLELPGVGPVLAERIVGYRSKYGGFSQIEDLRKIRGISQKKIEILRNKVVVK